MALPLQEDFDAGFVVAFEAVVRQDALLDEAAHGLIGRPLGHLPQGEGKVQGVVSRLVAYRTDLRVADQNGNQQIDPVHIRFFPSAKAHRPHLRSCGCEGMPPRKKGGCCK